MEEKDNRRDNYRDDYGWLGSFLRSLGDKLTTIIGYAIISGIFSGLAVFTTLEKVKNDPNVRAEIYTSTMATQDNLEQDKIISDLSIRLGHLEKACLECEKNLKELRLLIYRKIYSLPSKE